MSARMGGEAQHESVAARPRRCALSNVAHVPLHAIDISLTYRRYALHSGTRANASGGSPQGFAAIHGLKEPAHADAPPVGGPQPVRGVRANAAVPIVIAAGLWINTIKLKPIPPENHLKMGQEYVN